MKALILHYENKKLNIVMKARRILSVSMMLLLLNGGSTFAATNGCSMQDDSVTTKVPSSQSLYEELSSLVNYYGKMRIGFRRGEYAPFNNIGAIKAYKEARQYLESTAESDADSDKLQKLVDGL